MCNSITKQYKDDERPSTVTSYAPTRSIKINSSRSKPIHQVGESHVNIDTYAKEVKGKDTTFIYNDMSSSTETVDEIKKDISPHLDCMKFEVSAALTSSKPKAFEYREHTGEVNNVTMNFTESIQSSISDSAVSEGSLIVQNLPTSKINYATKKDTDKSPIPNLPNSKRKDYPIEKTEEKTKYEQHEAVYEVGSSSSDSDEFDDSMEVEVELDLPIEEKKVFKLNNKYTTRFNHQATKAKSTKNKIASTQKVTYDFNKDTKKFKLDSKYNRKSEG